MKQTRSTRRISLDTEIIADLEATEAETDAIRGGGRGGGGDPGAGPVIDGRATNNC